MTDIIIIGAGPAGLTSAIYALRSGLSAIVLDKAFYGGQVANTVEVENYPAIDKISGIDLSEKIYNQALELGAEIIFEEVEKVDFNNDIKTVTTSDGNIFESRAVIIANGAKRRKLGCEGEEKFTGAGVSYCANCDGAFFKNKDVVIVGGGNTALEDALFLSNNCNKVYIIHRRDEFRGEKILINSLMSRKNIEIIFNAVVEKIDGEKNVTSIKIKNLVDESVKNLNTSAVFVAVGLEPDNNLFSNIIDIDKQGYIIANESCSTSIKGIYVAGDSRTKLFRQIITAAADGAVAAFQAVNYINLLK